MKPCWAVVFIALAAGAVAMPAPAADKDQNPFVPSSGPKSDTSQSGATEPHLPGDAPTVPWSSKQIADAKAACAKALAGIAIEYQALPPLKEGLCGAPAPILVRSIGADPKVAIEPPATITCPLAATLVAWLESKVQPAAQAEIGSAVVKLHNAASYTCRNRYGGANTPISEHALANALDISDFVFASGVQVTVLNAWPRVVASVPAPPDPNPARLAGTTGSIAKASSQSMKPIPVASEASAAGRTIAQMAKIKSNPFVLPTPLPAPELDPAPPAEPDQPAAPLAERKTEFVREVHDDACKMFGTTLGPEANEAHKNHFHLDMKARRRAGFCDSR